MLMDLTELPKEFIENGWWVPLTTYLAYHPGETEAAVYARKSKGIWRDGIECKFIKGAGLWINRIAVNRWASTSKSREKKE